MSTAAFPHVVIRASAGSGKTYQLSNRYLGLLLAGAEPDAILAVTFTRKAAGEIFDRILLRLAEAATSDKKLRELAQAINQPQLQRADLAQLLGRTLRNLHRLRIGTLDSFFAKVAGALAWELGLPSGWSIASTIDNDILREEAVEAVIGGEDVASLLALLHLLTKGTAQRSVSELILSTVSDLHGLFCETNEAAWNKLDPPPHLSDEALREALAELRDCEQPTNKNVIKGLEEDFARAETGDWKSFVKKGIALKVLQGETTYSRWAIPEPLQAVYQQLLAQARAVLVGWVAKQTSGTWSLLSKFDGAYRQVQHRERLLQFGDITRAVARAAGAALHSTATHRLDGGVRHLLLDEFQDTSLDQWRALGPLVQGVVEHEEGSFFCVGDPKQAIYGWRGGLPEIFSAIDEEVPNLTALPLDRSFRSAPPVIDAVNQIFSKIDRHPSLGDYAAPIRAWREKFPQHETQRTELPGYVRLETTAAPEEASEPSEELENGDQEEGEELTKNQAHYRYVAQRVRDLAAAAPGMSIGVLTRSNQSIGWLITLLRQLGVSASEEGGNPLVDASAVQVVLSLLKLADHPGDTSARFHIASSPIARALEAPEYRNDYPAERFSASLRRELQDEGYGAAVYRWAGLLAPHCDRRELSRLQQLVEQAYAWPAAEPLRTQLFLAHLEKEKVGDPTAASIRVMTVHQSKGLQFGLVVLPELHKSLSGQTDSFVVGRPSPTAAVDTVCRYADSSTQALMSPRFQGIFRDHKAQKLGELLCVLYVALTRAEHALHMLIPPSTKSEKKLPLQVDGLLRAALVGSAPTLPQSLLWETGDPDWFNRLPAAPAASPQPEPKPLAPIRFAAPGSEPLRQRERRSPSSLEGGERVELASLFRAPPTASFDRGTLLHHWLEGIVWLDGGPPSVAELVARAERLRTKIDLSAFDLPAEAQRLLKELEAPAVRALLLQAVYLPGCSKASDGRPLSAGGCEIRVQNERSFAVPLEGQLLSGAIDRLCLAERGGKVVASEVLDFKTDELPSPQASRERADFYRPQIAAYKQAVAKMHQLTADCVSARLIFLRTGVVVPV